MGVGVCFGLLWFPFLLGDVVDMRVRPSKEGDTQCMVVPLTGSSLHMQIAEKRLVVLSRIRAFPERYGSAETITV
jgi:hypothetical protein